MTRREQYKVVINHEEQYRIVPAEAKVPDGWRSPGLPAGTLAEIEALLKRVWVKRKPGELEALLKSVAK